MRTTRLQSSLLAIVGVAACLPSLSATNLTPGQSGAPDIFSTAPTAGEYTLLGTTGMQNVNPLPGTSFNASYTEWVYADTKNVFCAGCLDFFINLSNAGPGILERISSGVFGSFSTDVGISTVTIAAGGPQAVGTGIMPFNVDRSGNGNVIGFNYIPTGLPVGTSESTVLLEIQTNATGIVPGTVSVQDGTAGFNAGFQPTSVPEPVPMAMALLGSGLIGLGLIRRRLGL
jgi:hypothetical protein